MRFASTVSIPSLQRRRSLGSSRNLPPPRGEEGGRLRDEPKERLRKLVYSLSREHAHSLSAMKASHHIGK